MRRRNSLVSLSHLNFAHIRQTLHLNAPHAVKCELNLPFMGGRNATCGTKIFDYGSDSHFHKTGIIAERSSASTTFFNYFSGSFRVKKRPQYGVLRPAVSSGCQAGETALAGKSCHVSSEIISRRLCTISVFCFIVFISFLLLCTP
jgi:hypothetical protein